MPTFKKLCADQLPGGQYHQPSSALRAKLARVPPTNDNAESLFGVFDRQQNMVPNASDLTLAGLTAWKLQGTGR